MSAQPHLMFNLLKELGKRRYKISLFCNKLNKFNNTGAQMLDSIYYKITLLIVFQD